MNDTLDFLLQALELKDEKRTGWELRKIENPESVADHSWGTALLTLIYGEEQDIDVNKALKIAIIHDIAEAETGDIPRRAGKNQTRINKEEKQALENKTIKEMSKKLEKNDLYELWKEYENRETQESKFVKDMDMIDLCLQALKYEKQQRYDKNEENENFEEYSDLDEFFATTEPRLNTDKGRQLFRNIKNNYQKAKKQNQ